MIWKSKGGWKRWYYDVQINWADGEGRALCGIERVDATRGALRCSNVAYEYGYTQLLQFLLILQALNMLFSSMYIVW